MLQLGIDGFSFADLHRASGLQRLHATFLSTLHAEDAALAARFSEYRAGVASGAPRGGLTPISESNLLVELAAHVGRFLGRLFRVEGELAQLQAKLADEAKLFIRTTGRTAESAPPTSFQLAMAPLNSPRAWS